MTETRTTRFGLVYYGSGSDSPSRVDWDETMDQIEKLGALDNGTVGAQVPLADQKPRRLSYRDWGAAPSWMTGATRMRTLYRADDDLIDWPVGGPTHPRAQDIRALEAQNYTDAAWRVSHPSRTDGPTSVVNFDGSVRHGGRVSIFDGGWDARQGRNPATLHVGTDAAAAADQLGRVFVRTVADSDRGIVVQGHGAGAGPAITVREPGGSDQHWIDAFGRQRTKQAVALGGTELADDALGRALTVSPSTAPTGVGGVLAHGRSSRTAVDPFAVRRYEPGAAGDLQMLRVGTRDVEIGSPDMPDAAAVVRLSAPLVVEQGEERHYLASDDRTGNGAAMRAYGLNAAGFWVTQPVSADNRGAQSGVPLTARAYAPNGVVAAQRLASFETVRPGADTKVMAYVDSTGGMISNAGWRGSGSDRPIAMRDVRQPVRHATVQRWVLPGHFGLYQGPRIDPGDREFTFALPEMRIRSVTSTNLTWRMRMETLTYCANPPFQGLDRVVINLYFAISINGGAYQRVDPAGWEMESVGMTTSPVAYVPGDSSTYFGQWLGMLNPGDRFQIRATVRNSDGLGPMRLRRADLNVEECIVEWYPQPDPQPLGYNLSDAQRQASIWSPS